MMPMESSSESVRGSRPPTRVFRTLEQVRDATTGPPFSLAELAYLTGFSREKIRIDVDLGILLAVRSDVGIRPPYRVLFPEAKAYLALLGYLRP
jgi:hypothetical protein